MPILKGRDTIAQAQSGTGKTTIFSVGALQSIDVSQRETQVLALAPTRELAEQTQKVMLALGDYMSVQCHSCIGGKSISEDIRRLDAGVHAVSVTHHPPPPAPSLSPPLPVAARPAPARHPHATSLTDRAPPTLPRAPPAVSST